MEDKCDNKSYFYTGSQALKPLHYLSMAKKYPYQNHDLEDLPGEHWTDIPRLTSYPRIFFGNSKYIVSLHLP
jgi:hypothetical protein